MDCLAQAEDHAKIRPTFALGHSSKLACIAEHVIESHFGTDSEFVITDFRIDNGTAALVKATNHRT